MKVFWDTDGTLVAYNPNEPFTLADERQLRPYAREVIELLEEMGVENYIWSRAGKENACAAAGMVGLSEDRCLAKPQMIEPQEMKVLRTFPDFVVDDNPEETVLMFPHAVVESYRGSLDDDALLGILAEIRKHYDALVRDGGESLNEFRLKFRRKNRTTSAVKMARRKYYRAHRGYYRRYKRKWKRKPRAKRLANIHKKLSSRFHSKLRKYRLRVAAEAAQG